MARPFVCCTLLTLAFLPALGCMALEETLIFQPRRFPFGDWQLDDVAHEDASFRSDDGTHLHGWFASVPQPRAVVLYCHGNAGNITICDWALALFSERLKCSIIVFDYRGYGKSEGSPTEAGVLADARAARRWLAARAGVPEKDIVVVGRSLGGGVAVDLAAKDGARALVLENTFASLKDVAEYHTSPLPVGWFMGMKLDSLNLIRQYHGPLLQTHGDADRVVPFDQGRRLFMAANEPKYFIAAHERGHNDLPTMEYVEKLDEFLRKLPEASVGTAGQ